MNIYEHQWSPIQVFADEQVEVFRAESPLGTEPSCGQFLGINPAPDGLLGNLTNSGRVFDSEKMGQVVSFGGRHQHSPWYCQWGGRKVLTGRRQPIQLLPGELKGVQVITLEPQRRRGRLSYGVCLEACRCPRS